MAATLLGLGGPAAAHPTHSADGATEPGVQPGRVFEPLHAGVRWPNFSARYMFVSGGVVRDAGIANLGGTLPLLGAELERQDTATQRAQPARIWEAGLQAGVFSLFDMASPSQDLANADYLVGPYVAVRQDRWSAFARLYHQSSHLGDEYIQQNPTVARVNLHWELLEFIAAYEPLDRVRVYAGGGALVRRNPNVGRGQARIGLEASGDRALFWGLRPVGALDVSWLSRSRWRTSVSLHIGLELRPNWWRRVRVRWVLEYYGGAVPDGQFLRERTDRYGTGLSLWF